MGRLNNLPEEIMLEILSRLPTESALDCKLVCKPWKRVVSHPNFGQRHLDRLNESAAAADDSGSNKVSFICLNENSRRKLYYVECDDENRDEMFVTRKMKMQLIPAFPECSFAGSCNGIVCFKSGVDRSNLQYYGPVYICNPITREYLILPDMVGDYDWSGFGYSALTNQYKVVRICPIPCRSNFGIAQVYTLGSGNGWRNAGEVGMSWKKLESICNYAGVFANGALHWVNIENGMILAFDLTDEVFSDIPAPPSAARDGVAFSSILIQLGVLGDFLSATYNFDDNSSEIWLLKKTKDSSVLSWSKHFSLDGCTKLLFEFKRSGRLLFCWYSLIFSYDPKAAVSDMEFDMSISEAIPHKNTLISLKALGEKDTKTMEFGEKASSSEVTETSASP